MHVLLFLQFPARSRGPVRVTFTLHYSSLERGDDVHWVPRVAIVFLNTLDRPINNLTDSHSSGCNIINA